MSVYSKYHYMTTKELLRRVDEARVHSALIEELSRRLEGMTVVPGEAMTLSCQETVPEDEVLTCPHCEGLFTIGEIVK